MCLFSKRLDKGTFAAIGAPSDDACAIELDDATFEALLDGLPIGPDAPRTPRRRRRIH
jgi:hypothetical protein